MNGPPPNGNEGIVDIFVLSNNETLAPVLKEHLEQNGYHVTLFDDGNHLLETLKSGKPNILICDTTDPSLSCYDICRQMKADRDLWIIPVLILTGASELSDLLFVLDSNADNFISLPYDPPYLLSLLTGMLDTPVERPTPEQIKTQFKIQHNDQIFVITADRRKLLEFLLSSFEIAVTKHEEISRAKDRIGFLDQSIKDLESESAENKRSLRAQNETLDQKEQDLKSFRVDVSEKDRTIAGKTRENASLQSDLESTRSLLSETGEKLRAAIEQTNAATISHEAEVRDLNERIAQVSDESDALARENADIKESLRQAAARCSLFEKSHSDLQLQKDQMDSALVSLKREFDTVNAAYDAEKTRSLAAEEEIKTILSSKAEREQELSRVIEELRDASNQQESDISRYAEELADAKAHGANLEVQITTLEKEKELVESALGLKIDDLQKQLADLLVKTSAATAVIDEKETALKALDINFAAANIELEKMGERVRLLAGELEETRTALTDEKLSRASREDEIAELASEKEKGLEYSCTLSKSLEEVQTSLKSEREQRRDSEEELNAVIREQAATLASLQGAHADVKIDLDLHRNDLDRTRRDLDLAAKTRSELETTLATAREKILSLEQELHTVSAGHAQAGQQARSLGDELEQVRAALDTEKRLRHVAEESLQSALSSHERSSLDIGRIMGERSSLAAALEAERIARQDAGRVKDDAIRDLESIRAKHAEAENQQALDLEKQAGQLRNLSDDLESARSREKSLENLVETLRTEKLAAETAVSSLSREIEQARTALADEWEDHMNDQEQLRVAAEQKDQPVPGPVLKESDVEWIKKRAIIVKGPDLPMVVRPAYVPMEISRVPEPETPKISGVEDLFEDDEPKEHVQMSEPVPPSSPVSGEDAAGTSVGDSKLPDPGSCEDEPAQFIDDDPEDGSDPAYSEDSEEESYDGSEDGSDEPVDEDEDEDEEEPGEEQPDVPRKSAVTPGFSFNRAQWLDLLRWSHHSGALSQEQRMQIVRMGRLIQRGRRLTQKQEEQVREMLTLAQALGYHFA